MSGARPAAVLVISHVTHNDNGLAETKNGAIVRKHLGYSHIPQRFAAEVNAFCREFLNLRVEEDVIVLLPHRPTRAQLTHVVLHRAVSLHQWT